MEVPRYKRVLLKISGEALMGEGQYGIDVNVLRDISRQISLVVGKGV